MWTLGRRICFLLPYAIIGIAVLPEAAAATDVQSTKWTPPGEYTSGIEGPAADLAGNVYAANFGRQGSVGVVRPGSSRSARLVVLPGHGVSSSTRVLPSQALVIADYKRHALFLFKNGRLRKALQSNRFSQPNDVTVAADSTLFLSDPNWGAGTGRIWRVSGIESDTPRLELLASPRPIGVVNGIDLSADEKTLYTSESKSDKSRSSNEIWAYAVVDGQLMSPRLLYKFATADVDGLRTDIDGNIFVARIGAGEIAILGPDGALRGSIKTNGSEPNNVAFGGADGRTLFITQRSGGFLEQARVDRPGREFCLQAGAADPRCVVGGTGSRTK
jgi:hypothetical protein